MYVLNKNNWNRNLTWFYYFPPISPLSPVKCKYIHCLTCCIWYMEDGNRTSIFLYFILDKDQIFSFLFYLFIIFGKLKAKTKLHASWSKGDDFTCMKIHVLSVMQYSKEIESETLWFYLNTLFQPWFCLSISRVTGF